ncbi:MAG: alpha/beta hydrolase [Bacteroidota bacterium]|nr:alpha/beta hydrolase [Bacteroidota bacterium]
MNKEIVIKGKRIFYRVHGNGKPAMLVHGFGETGDVWRNQVESLRNKFMFIVPDLPGSGQSEMIDDMSMEGMAEIVKIILDTESPLQTSPGGGGFANTQTLLTENSLHEENTKTSGSSKAPSFGEPVPQRREGLGEVALIGHSMGGYIVLAFAEKYPERLSAFGLFHSTAYADTEEKKAVRRKGIEFIREHGAFEFLKNTTPNLFSPITKQYSPALVSQFVESLRGFSADTLIAYYESMIKRPERLSILRSVQVPVLFIIGEQDNAIPLQDGLKQCHLPAKSYIHILHQSGHMGMLEEAEKSNKALEHFLSDI